MSPAGIVSSGIFSAFSMLDIAIIWLAQCDFTSGSLCNYWFATVAVSVLLLPHQVLSSPKYAEAAQGMSAALQVYSKRRQPYARAADEIELAIYTRHAQQGGLHGHSSHLQRPQHIKAGRANEMSCDVYDPVTCVRYHTTV